MRACIAVEHINSGNFIIIKPMSLLGQGIGDLPYVVQTYRLVKCTENNIMISSASFTCGG